MRKVLMLAALVAAAASFMVVGGTAGADPGNGATITKEFGCFINLGGFVAFSPPGRSMEVDTTSGNTKITCHFKAEDFLSALPTETVKLTGWTCSTFAGLTTDSFLVLNKSGNGTARCEIKANA